MATRKEWKMIDFIRLVYWDKTVIEPFIKDAKNFPEMKSEFKYHTGELIYPYTASFHNMSVTVNKKSVRLKNSLHKFYNAVKTDEAHNHNDFSYSL